MTTVQSNIAALQCGLGSLFLFLMLIRYCVRFFKKSKEEPGDFTGCIQFVAGLLAVTVVVLMCFVGVIYITVCANDFLNKV